MYRCMALLCLCVVCNLHAEVLKVENIQFKAKKTDIDFGEPIILPFVSASQPKPAKKINDYIYIDNLKTLAPTNTKVGISRKLTEADDDPIAGITSMQYKILLNDGKVLSLQFDSEFCGAYCEESATSYNFDATTGRHLTLQDIFTVNGIEMLKKKVYAARVATMKKEIKRLQKEAAKPKKKNQKKDEFEADPEEAILLYETCITENAASHKDEVSSGDTHELAYFFIDANGFTFTHERCSNHAMRALDTIDDFYNTLSLQTLTPYLTDYAKSLLLNMPLKKPIAFDVFDQIMYGTIGDAKITMKLTDTDGAGLSGVYFYQKIGQAITLDGTREVINTSNVTYVMAESPVGKVKPVIRARIQGNALVGEWYSDKKLPFKVSY